MTRITAALAAMLVFTGTRLAMHDLGAAHWAGRAEPAADTAPGKITYLQPYTGETAQAAAPGDTLAALVAGERGRASVRDDDQLPTGPHRAGTLSPDG